MKGARQVGGKECGYYVMKHMQDLIDKFEIASFPKVYM